MELSGPDAPAGCQPDALLPPNGSRSSAQVRTTQSEANLGIRRRLVSVIGLALAVNAVVATSAYAEPQLAAQEPPGSQSTSGDADADLEAAIANTLEANPGSVRTGENTIELQPGVMVAYPIEGQVGTQALSQCPQKWLCAWPHSDFRGPMYGIRQGDCIEYFNWYWEPGGTIIWASRHPGSGWTSWARSISSVYNNLIGVPQASFWSGAFIGPYHAPQGTPIPYVGSLWNDWIQSGCAF